MLIRLQYLNRMLNNIVRCMSSYTGNEGEQKA